MDNIRDDVKEYKTTKGVVQNLRAWHVKTKAGPLLHGEDLL